jgi:manganese/zinc/iron transport system substrate-binding protein
MKTMKTFLTLLLMSVGLAACGADPAPVDDDTVTVVATIGQIADVARNIGGERVEVNQLLSAGTDPHTYVPVESDLEALQNADLILYNGLNLEAQLASVIQQVGDDRGIAVTVVGETLPDDLILEATDEDAPDPHIWGDVSRWALAAEGVRDALIALDPEGEATYTENAEAYLSDLDALHNWALESYDSLDNPRLVTAHDAFEYTGQAYDLMVFAPQGISTEAEASVADIQAAVDYVVENEVPAIFFESAIPRDTVDAIVEGAADQGWEVAIGGELYADAMGPQGTPEGTYIGMVRSNVETIVTALGGTVAPWPLEE